MIGGSFGTAVFGAIFANLLFGNVLHALHLARAPSGFNLNAENPAAIHNLPAHGADRCGQRHRPHHPDHVPHRGPHRLRGVPPELDPPRDRAPQVHPELGAGAEPRHPEPRSSLDEVQRLFERAASRENRSELYGMLSTRAGLELEPRAVWLLYRLADRPDSPAPRSRPG